MKAIGIDSGSTTTKGVLICDHQLIDTFILPTSYNPKQTIRAVFDHLRGGEDIYTVTTGYGRGLLEVANHSVTEITCHAKGAHYLCPELGMVVDVGGQDSKVIALDQGHLVKDFLMNDKCAAGTGSFIEFMMRLLHKDLFELDAFLEGATPVPINSMCAVFAESEVIGMLSRGVLPSDVAMGVVDSVAKRTANFVKRLPLKGPVFFSGGLASSEVIRSALEKHLSLPVITHEKSQWAGAIGAAVIGLQKNK